jgi:hypothetical protein
MNFESVEGFLGGTVAVHSTSGRGFTPEELAERALDKIVYVGSKSHPVIRDQAEAFKNNLRVVLIQYLHQAVRSDRTTIANRLREAGHPELTILLND